MDLDFAVSEHLTWRLKLRTAITMKRPVDAGAIASDTTCQLGRWLSGEIGLRYGKLPAYAKAVSEHRRFHQQGSNIVALINTGKYDEAARALESGTPYSRASQDFLSALSALKLAAID
jgi:hypothetical protein